MKTILSALVFLWFGSLACAQVAISGTVIEKPGLPIIGANIFIEGSYDGTVSDDNGSFSFSTDLIGEQVLSVSYLGYETKTLTMDVSAMKDLTIKLRESANTLDAVEISASTFKAGDNSKLAVLKPLDMVTTAGSMGDAIAAIQTLPGTQSNADDGRLFVRGGDANETKIYIDGMRVFSPYTRSISGTPARGRYSPFLFSGVSFSTGGYDAEFGQALSGVLDMQTIDEPVQTETNISLMTVGLALGHTQKKEKSSISFSASYIDLSPYYLIMPTRLNFNKPFRGFSGEMVHRYKLGKGLLKTYVAADAGSFNIDNDNLNTGLTEEVDILNVNGYLNSTWSSFLTDATSIKLGMAYGVNRDFLNVDDMDIDTELDGLHLKAAFKTVLSDFLILDYGLEYFNIKDQLGLTGNPFFDGYTTDRSVPAAFTSVDYFFNKDLAFNIGLRYEHHNLISTNEMDPRITLAYKVGKNAQVSAAYGHYHQEVNPDYLSSETKLANEKSRHYLLNYNFKNDNSIVRLEGYYKKYDDLLTYDEQNFFSNVANDGGGEAYGFDVFWRSSKLIKYMDFWISYSWLQNQRKYRSYPAFATPSYSTDHNLSIVTKRWFDNLKSQLGVTYTMASGRPYDNPATPEFMTERSGFFHNVSLSWAYLISQQKILFASVSNAPRFENEFGYRYADAPGANGSYVSELIRPNDDSFFFIGFFITMSTDKQKNQLDTL